MGRLQFHSTLTKFLSFQQVMPDKWRGHCGDALLLILCDSTTCKELCIRQGHTLPDRGQGSSDVSPGVWGQFSSGWIQRSSVHLLDRNVCCSLTWKLVCQIQKAELDCVIKSLLMLELSSCENDVVCIKRYS